MEYRRHCFVSVSFWYKSIHVPLLSPLIKVSKKGTSLSLNFMVNWIVSFIEFSVSNNSSGFTLFLFNVVWKSSKKLPQFYKISSWNYLSHLYLKESRQTSCFYMPPCLTCWAFFGSLVQTMCNCTSLSQVHEFSWGHWRTDRLKEETLAEVVSKEILLKNFQ